MAETVEVNGHTLKLSHTDKVFFPKDGITKGEMIEYYRRIAETMLPYLAGRPVTMKRYPDGIDGESFYQKNVPGYFPRWIKRVTVKKEAGGSITHVVCDSAATLMYLADQACIAVHVWLSAEDAPYNPDQMIFDLDPADNTFGPVRKASLALRDLLRELGLESFVKSTGSRGLHVVVPLDRGADFDRVRGFAREVVEVLEKRNPGSFTMEQSKAKRGESIYIDIMRNSYAQMAVAPYSLRARPGAPVAFPLYWEEVEEGGIGPQTYNMRNIFQRLDEKGDPWRSIGDNAGSVEEAARRLQKMSAGVGR